ncbi:hypothetical protein L13192_08419 [Pyrenophora tritici-repentis]|nr:hypothetical protein L13192_08419 [Pyrenophora tritici-repentis]
MPSSRPKQDPAIIEARHKAERKEAKAAAKKNWEAWVEENDHEGMLLPSEPAKDEGITQTDSVKHYGLKPADLVTLLHFEKKSPMKLAMLAGVVGDDMHVLDKGKEMWKEQHSDEDTSSEHGTPEKEETPEERWAEYTRTHSLTLDTTDGRLNEEPTISINRRDGRVKYDITGQEWDCLPFFLKTVAYGVRMKVYKESEVKLLGYRKMAVLAGGDKLCDFDELLLLKMGEQLFEERESRLRDIGRRFDEQKRESEECKKGWVE